MIGDYFFARRSTHGFWVDGEFADLRFVSTFAAAKVTPHGLRRPFNLCLPAPKAGTSCCSRPVRW